MGRSATCSGVQSRRTPRCVLQPEFSVDATSDSNTCDVAGILGHARSYHTKRIAVHLFGSDARTYGSPRKLGRGEDAFRRVARSSVATLPN